MRARGGRATPLHIPDCQVAAHRDQQCSRSQCHSRNAIEHDDDQFTARRVLVEHEQFGNGVEGYLQIVGHIGSY
jgi:hypothetical protein